MFLEKTFTLHNYGHVVTKYIAEGDKFAICFLTITNLIPAIPWHVELVVSRGSDVQIAPKT